MRRSFLALVLVLGALGCGDEASSPPADAGEDLGPGCELLPGELDPLSWYERAPEGDAVCAGRADCFLSPGAGSPISGCPSDCSCLCWAEECYEYACTADLCDERVFR